MYYENNTCNPFYGPLSPVKSEIVANASCSLGGLVSYAINVFDAASALAGVNFARENNVRLIIKNTGHDALGRSTGKGSLALWTYHLKSVSFTNYSSPRYSGPAARVGAGIQVGELCKAAAAKGYRATGGTCDSVGVAGGWIQSAGHGPLASSYGLGSDQALEYEHADLYWTLSGGGPGNYAIVLSVTLKVHPDGPVAGSRLLFVESNSDKYWAAVEAWQRHLLHILDSIPGFQSLVALAAGGVFQLNYATLPDGSKTDLITALTPFYDELASLGISATLNETVVHDTYLKHYTYYEGNDFDGRNATVGDRMIPRSLVRNATRLSQLTDVYKSLVQTENSFVYLISQNVSHAVAGNKAGDNEVLPAWRDSLYIANFGVTGYPLASFTELKEQVSQKNKWQIDLRDITPRGGSYMNEAIFNYPYWKEDYYGTDYERLAAIKNKYDPAHVLWATTSPGSAEAYELRRDGHLCKA
ncbi:uncharacterized protein KD926_004052 [Aspergillus affinis]|uniref:uncharacterized protein n=1 Tax=Aspergillus affinis TaxID=1070780 RepID=UPI0022FDB957|nr:uncharacterized protein KD926_004052 [Aspergillus affinis]KAI9046214.1 hypothetical protein KD926_004052 [Aspergillus affinis]